MSNMTLSHKVQRSVYVRYTYFFNGHLLRVYLDSYVQAARLNKCILSLQINQHELPIHIHNTGSDDAGNGEQSPPTSVATSAPLIYVHI